MLLRFLSLIFLSVYSTLTLGQMQIQLGVEYDLENSEVIVLAKPNFSQQNFTWGPSQVSLVIPAQKGGHKLGVNSTHAGLWSDNSLVVSPEKSRDYSFHGFGTNGAKVDLIAGEETELFRVKLEAIEDLHEVRLFEIGLDPESYDKGMSGSDFRHSIVGLNGQELYVGNFEKFAEQFLVIEPSEELAVYPNPSAGQFNLDLPQALAGMDIKLKYYDVNGALLFEEMGTYELFKSTQRMLPSSVQDQVILIRAFDGKGVSFYTKALIKK